MTSRRTFLSTALTLAALPVLTNGQTCCAAAKDEKKAACNADASNLKATGASISFNFAYPWAENRIFARGSV